MSKLLWQGRPINWEGVRLYRVVARKNNEGGTDLTAVMEQQSFDAMGVETWVPITLTKHETAYVWGCAMLDLSRMAGKL